MVSESHDTYQLQENTDLRDAYKIRDPSKLSALYIFIHLQRERGRGSWTSKPAQKVLRGAWSCEPHTSALLKGTDLLSLLVQSCIQQVSHPPGPHFHLNNCCLSTDCSLRLPSSIWLIQTSTFLRCLPRLLHWVLWHIHSHLPRFLLPLLSHFFLFPSSLTSFHSVFLHWIFFFIHLVRKHSLNFSYMSSHIRSLRYAVIFLFAKTAKVAERKEQIEIYLEKPGEASR